MIFKRIYLLLLLLFLPLFATAQKSISTAKPWAYWWWMGSAVNKKDITQNLEDFARAGFGGMHIIPIYGVKGEEAHFIPYLSSAWLEMLNFTVQEANRLGLGIDMTVGTGWPFGGAHVTEADAAKAFSIKKPTKTGDKYTLEIVPTKQKVKRPAPGGEGWVLDHFNATAIDHYFEPFKQAFSNKNYGVRAFYNDSYEVYGANWTPDFLQKFKILRGYDLGEHLDVLAKDTAITDREKRIWSDYHETLSDILLEDFTKKYVQFSHQFNKIARNESHGSPANILDLYAASDVPESEFFGSKPYDIPLYKQDEDYEIKRFGTPGGLILKLASSAAHINGKKLVSSETATWLGNHFKVSLKQVKPIIDESFVSGINHIFYHGVPYSPPSAPFPGWLFYASTNFNQQSHFWEHLPQLNGYIERCQNLLQNSQSDNDVLLYFPIYDLWHTVGKNAKIHPIDVHAILREGMFNSALGKVANELQGAGYAFDFVSDRQLQNLASNTEGVKKYKTIVVPPAHYMPLATLQSLDKMKNAGIKVVFANQLPQSVNGFLEYEKRQSAFDKIIKTYKSTTGLGSLKGFLSLRRETLTENGLQFIRQKTDSSTLYFIINQSQKFKNKSIQLATSGEAVRLFDPLHQVSNFINFKKIDKTHIEIPLELPSGESIFIEIFNKKTKSPIVSNSEKRNPQSDIILRGLWQVNFLKGNPFIPKSYTTDTLESWTILGDTAAQYFSGKARYSLNFKIEKDKVNKSAWLNLGDVRESAEVKLNGQSLGVAWCLPMRVRIPEGILKADNKLEIEVINLSANRIRYMDKQSVPWKKFYDINMVDIGYRPFDASGWKVVASGLLGPVTLTLD